MTALYNEIEPFAVEWLENLARAGHIAAGTIDARSIADLTPEDVRHATQAHFFAGIGIWSAAARAAGWPDDVRLFTGSCPCFVAGTLVVTTRGLIPIEDVVIGDLVMTHRHRWRSVTTVMRSEKETLILKGQGHWGLETTAEHPFLTGADEWTEAAHMAGKRWACVRSVPELQIPALPIQTWRGNSHEPSLANMATWKLIGYWLGNGWTRERKQVVLCAHLRRGQMLVQLANDAGLTGNLTAERTAARIRIGARLFAEWLDDNFGHYAPTKKIPTWLLSAPAGIVEAFLSGLFMADGHKEKPIRGSTVRRLTTTSRQLAVGVRILINRLGGSASIGRHVPKRTRCVIEGRTVAESGFYRVTWYERARSYHFEENHGWGLVRTATTTSIRKPVYNIAVADDESYVADGIVVHNCQPFSDAGAGAGFSDERHLWPEWFRIIRECRPPVIVGEQVSSPAALDWLDVVFADLEGAGYACAAADLPAAGIGAPHRRQRIYFVAFLEGPELDAVRAGLRAGRLAHDDDHRCEVVGQARVHEDGQPGHDAARCGAPCCAVGAGALSDAARDRRLEGIGAPQAAPDERPRSADDRGPDDADDDDVDDAGALVDAARERSEGHEAADRDPGYRWAADRGGLGGGLGDPDGARLQDAEDAGADRGDEGDGGPADERRTTGDLEPERTGPARAGALGDAGGDGDREHAGELPSDESEHDERTADGDHAPVAPGPAHGPGPVNGFWADAVWIPCADGKARPVKPGLECLVAGSPNRVGRLRAYGNGIVKPQAQAFLEVVIDLLLR